MCAANPRTLSAPPMYFEARSHVLVPVAHAAAAVRMVHSGRIDATQQLGEFHCPCWLNAAGQRVALVSDTSIDDANFAECAVVNLDTRRQLESITFAWCDNEAEKVRYVEGCENDAGLSDDDVAVPFGDNPADLDIPADFTCSCCGESFTSTLRQELPHDQDSGYGHCPACFPATAQAA